MNRDLALKYQAYVDGELPDAEARQVALALEQDAEARALVDELRGAKELLAGNELDVTLPETREFYWNRIQREIERLEAQPAGLSDDGGWLALFGGWRRFLAPLAGVAVIAFLAMAAVRFYNPTPIDHLAEIENLADESTSYSFRSDNMFVVWVQDSDAYRDAPAEFIDYDAAIAQ